MGLTILVVALLNIGCVLTQTVDQCFRRFGNCDIIYSDPFRKVWRVNDTECLQNCASETPRCRAIVYDTEFSICNLYGFTGNSGAGFLIPAFKKVYYEVTDASCLAKFSTVSSVETTTAVASVEITTAGTVEGPALVETTVPGPVTTPAVTSTLAPAPLPITEQSSSAPETSSTLSGTTQTEIPSSTVSASIAPVQRFIQPRVGCPPEKQPVYLGYMETNITAPASVSDGPSQANAGDVATCMKACSENQGQLAMFISSNCATTTAEDHGREINCRSFTYSSSAQLCIFHAFDVEQKGTGRVSNIKGVHTFVKLCVAVSSHNSACKNAMLVTAPGVQLRGHVVARKDNTRSLEDCAALCLAEALCKSFTYFAREKRCHLHDVDSLTAPDAIASATDSTFVENSCDAARRQQAHVDRAGVNRFETIDGPVSQRSLVSEKQAMKPSKTAVTDDGDAVFTQWGVWTRCLKRTGGVKAKIRVRSCKTNKGFTCRGKKAEYKPC